MDDSSLGVHQDDGGETHAPIKEHAFWTHTRSNAPTPPTTPSTTPTNTTTHTPREGQGHWNSHTRQARMETKHQHWSGLNHTHRNQHQHWSLELNHTHGNQHRTHRSNEKGNGGGGDDSTSDNHIRGVDVVEQGRGAAFPRECHRDVEDAPRAYVGLGESEVAV